MRKSLEDTWQYLASQGEETPRRPDGRPFVHDAMPNFDDEELGFTYFRYRLEDADNGNLTLPRTYVERSWFARVSFAGTDLTESRMCWNEFEQCDFSGADLSRCDMRASVFKNCVFANTIMRDADLRRTYFEDCDLSGADVAGALVGDTDTDGWLDSYLNDEQRATVAWQAEDGPEPPGG